MRNPAGQSSKADIVESLLRLGDIARNTAVGEVQTALGKAKLLMEKYGLIQFDGRYQELVEKLAAFLRGEKVHATREEPKEEFRGFRDFYGFDPFARARKREARKEARRAERKARAAQRRAEKKTARAEQSQSYKRPMYDDKIIWLWTLSYSPKRGKAGERWKAYWPAKTIREMIQRGGKWSDVKWNIQHGYMKIDIEE